eukprot:CAMPEP_0174865956 /NCGR_PEP_ID=MMETSP1114-20130205/61265_1 /TAXON_ID=312471 /ORGANISM="Neobodo designis, Strain CCAP 1951/1" /LENGTH=172 /DNA_ID=CAMNT_0016101095 /DNA_START=50 /DNA_END=568 /DNA_ORIENTATION=-
MASTTTTSGAPSIPVPTTSPLGALDEARRANLPVARRIEGVMRQIDADVLAEGREGRAVSSAQLCLATSGFFVGGGSYLAWRGYQAAHPLWCPLRSFIKNNTVCKILSPVCGAGIVIAATGAVQSVAHITEWDEAAQKRSILLKRIKDLEAEKNELIEEAKAKAGAPKAAAA